MRRSHVLFSGYLLAATSVIGLFGTLARADETSSDGSPPAAAAGPASAPTPGTSSGSAGGAPQGKILYTIPEDGMGSNDLVSASSRLVRDEIAAHPNEDLIICIAGCRPGPDRIVYSQPADPIARAQPATAKVEPSVTEQNSSSVAPQPQSGEQTEKAASLPQGAAPEKPGQSQLVPTMAAPALDANAEVKPAAAEPPPASGDANAGHGEGTGEHESAVPR